MSDIIAFPDDGESWAQPEVMEHFRARVKERADKRLAECPTAKQAMEIAMPETAARALYLLSETDTTQADVATSLGVSKQAIGRLIYHHADLWEKRRPMLAAQFTHAADLAGRVAIDKMERLLEDPAKLDETPLNHLAIAAGVFLDKAATLNGMATAKVEHVVVGKLDEFEALRAEAKKRLEERKSAAIEVEIVKDGAEVAEA